MWEIIKDVEYKKWGSHVKSVDEAHQLQAKTAIDAVKEVVNNINFVCASNAFPHDVAKMFKGELNSELDGLLSEKE